MSRITSGFFGLLVLSLCPLLLVTCGRDNPTQQQLEIPVRVVVTPETTNLASAGQTVHLSARALDSVGREVTKTTVTWRSSDTSIARVSTEGLVTAVRKGSVIITATAGQKTGNAKVTVSDSVKRALVALFRATGGENWKNSTNWLSDEPISSWHGVTTTVAGEATGTRPRAAAAGSALNLPDNGLSGTIPPELGDLIHLRELDLSENGLTGNIPPELGKLVRLELLDLSGNYLSGPVPAELGNLVVLNSLRLHDNADLSGPLPLSLSSLTRLETLDLTGTGLCAPANTGIQRWLGGVTTRRGIATCGAVADQDRKALIALYEATNGSNWTNKTNWLSGAPLDRWHGVSTNAGGRVNALRLSGNRLSGPVPPVLGNLSALATLDLGNNQLTGTIPTALGNLTELVSLDLSNNRLSGPIPTALLTLANLQTLNLSGNLFNLDESDDRAALVALYNATEGPNWTNNTNWLSDEPLEEWYGVSTNTSGRVDSLELDSNSLSGSIPPELGNLTNLTWLVLASNDLSGRIPAQLSNLTNLTWAILANNDLTGPVPAQLSNLTNLRGLVLSYNELSGRVPSELGNLSNLIALDLSGNVLSGRIPLELGSLSNLVGLYLDDNRLSGSLPSELGNLSKLGQLWLNDNADLSGPLPASFTGLSNLRDLRMTNTGLCVPAGSAFQSWLDGVSDQRGVVNCAITPTGSDDRAALVALYNATEGPNWTNSANWLSDAPLGEWYGVSTNTSGRVDTLNLVYNQLSGSIPPELGNLTDLTWLVLASNDLSGRIPSQLGSLNSLIGLYLSYNELSGRIPSQLGSLNNLIVLDLSGNVLSRRIPLELGSLSNLDRLYLDDNRLSGSLPSELGNLSKLGRLWLNDNADLSGPLPASFTGLSNLRDLRMTNTGLCVPAGSAFQSWLDGVSDQRGVVNCAITPTGSDDRAALVALYNATNGPNWTNSTNWLSDAPLGEWYGVITNEADNVTHIQLHSNNLNGVLPAELGSLTNLKLLGLGNNQLNGTIPAELGKLANLEYLYLPNTQLSGPIPAELGNLTNLRSLNLEDIQLSGPIPSWLGNLTNLRSLNLGNNQLSGPIPSELGNLTNLERLVLHANQLSGTIPSELNSLIKLETIALSSNQLTGSIPSWLGNFSSLGELNLSFNRLNGSIPAELGKLANLEYLNLSNNLLSGPIPSELGDLESIEQLFLRRNRLTGSIPVTLADLDSLNRLSVGGNNVCVPRSNSIFMAWLNDLVSHDTTTIPTCETDADAPDLEVSSVDDRAALVALYNATNGPNWTNSTNWLSDAPLGEWYGVITNEADNVTHIQLYSNNLNGVLPAELGSLTNLKILGLGNNQLNGTIPAELGKLANLEYLYLPNTQLSGPIPAELGNLTNLRSLGLQNNQLSGTIPAELGNLTNLERLYLYRNQLSGTIPSELNSLIKLEAIGLSYNQLTGAIPSWLGNLSSLGNLNLSFNGLNGSIPAELGKLANLEHLFLSNNQLSGPIPSELGDLESIEQLFLHRNRLTGSIPVTLADLDSLNRLSVGGNNVCVPRSNSIFMAWLNGLVSHDTTTIPTCETDADAPDLEVSSVDPTEMTLVAGGESSSVAFTILNSGLGASDSTKANILVSSDLSITTDDLVFVTFPVPALAASNSTEILVDLFVESGVTPGVDYLGMCVEPVAGESNTRNNCSSPLTVTVVSSAAVRPEGRAGASTARRIIVTRVSEAGR